MYWLSSRLRPYSAQVQWPSGEVQAMRALVSCCDCPRSSAWLVPQVPCDCDSTLLLGQARGAALCGLADSELPVHEYTALQIKKAVVGNGHAAKEQVQKMVQHLLELGSAPTADSADALACAICHAHMGPLVQRLKQTGGLAPSHQGSRLRGGRLVR